MAYTDPSGKICSDIFPPFPFKIAYLNSGLSIAYLNSGGKGRDIAYLNSGIYLNIAYLNSGMCPGLITILRNDGSFF